MDLQREWESNAQVSFWIPTWTALPQPQERLLSLDSNPTNLRSQASQPLLYSEQLLRSAPSSYQTPAKKCACEEASVSCSKDPEFQGAGRHKECQRSYTLAQLPWMSG